MKFLAAFSFLLLLPAVHLAQSEWPQFRGPSGDGITASAAPLEWSEEKGVSWKTGVPGKGWSSPVVADGRIWLTSAVEVLPTQEEKAALLSGVEANKHKVRQVAKAIQLLVLGYDLETGAKIAEHVIQEIAEPGAIHSLNSYASPTPVVENGRLYAHFGTYGTSCLDPISGQVFWNRQFKIEHSVGPGSSPFLHGNLLVLICDGTDAQYVVAVDKNSGETVWKTDRPEMRASVGDRKKAYSTPIVAEVNGREQLVCMGSQWLVAYEPATGKELWKVDHGSGFSVVPRPVVAHDHVYVSTGFGKPELWAVKTDGAGEVTESHVSWKQPKRIPSKPSPVVVGDEIYVMQDGGVLSCFDVHTGEDHYVERVGGNYSASPLVAGDRLYFFSQEGKTTVLALGSKFEVLAENLLEGQIMASPGVVDGSMILRTDTALYRIGE